MMLGIMKRNFSILTIDSLVLLYKSMVRSHLDTEALKKVQKRATKIFPALKNTVIV